MTGASDRGGIDAEVVDDLAETVARASAAAPGSAPAVAGPPIDGGAGAPPEARAAAIVEAVAREARHDGRRLSLRLAAPPGFRLLDLGAIAADVVATATEQRQLHTVYFDTDDLRLVRWGVSLRHRAGEGWTLALPTPSGADHIERRFPTEADRPPPEARDLVAAYARSAELVPVARLRTVRRVVVLQTHEGQPLAEIDDDEVSVLDGRRLAARFREVDVGVEASAAALLGGIVERLHAGGAGVVDPTPKLIHALGSRATGPPEIVVEELGRSAAAGDAVRRAIASSVTRLLRHDSGIRLGGDDPEMVHQARVATRRLRSDLRTFAPLLDSEWNASLREELRWLAGQLGSARDAEVLLERLGAALATLDPVDARSARRLLGELAGTAEASRVALLRAMRTPRYVALLDRLVAAAQAPPLTPEAEGRAVAALEPLLEAPWRKLRRAVRELSPDPLDAELHAIRIRAKRARYAAEAVAPVLGRRAAAFGRAAAELQTVLGEHQDAVVARAWLRERGGRGAAAFVAGQLAERERAGAEASRRRWPAAWKGLRRRRARGWT